MELNCSGTKIVAELKIAAELKFGRGDPWLMRTPRPGAKRSAELKLQWN